MLFPTRLTRFHRSSGGRLSRFPLLLAATLAAPLSSGCDRPDPNGGPAGSADERLDSWAGQPEETAVPVALGFGATLPDSAVASVLERHNLRPYVAYLTAAGLTTAQRRDQSRASLELLGEAREQAIGQLRTSMCAQQGRARSMLAETPPSDPTPVYREVLARFFEIQKALPQLELGAPIVYGVEAVGALADVKAAASDPTVVVFEPGWRGRVAGRDTVVVRQPAAPPDSVATPPAELASMSAEEARTKMAQLADNAMGACAQETGP